jgi:YD repeat-containing protein
LTTNGVWIYTWDGENRLIGVSSNGVDVAAYAYDFASRRVMKTAQGVTRGYLYDGWNLIRESAGTNVTHYIWGLDLSGSIQGAGGVGGLLAVISPLPLGEGQGVGNAVYYPSFDANGSAPSEARRFLRGGSPRRVRISHPLVPSVGTMEEESNPNEVV